MHRMPLDLPVAPCLWKRSSPEYELFEPTMLCGNVIEMDLWLKELKYESESFFKGSVDFATGLMENASKLINSQDEGNLKEALYALQKLIYRAPVDTNAFIEALLSRGMCYIKLEQLSNAANDFEMYIHCKSVVKPARALFRVHGYLSFCYYMMRISEKAHHHVQECTFYKSQLSPAILREEQEDVSGRFILENVCKFEDELCCRRGFQLKIIENKNNQYIPYKGFNCNSEIPLTSACCYYVTKTDSFLGIYTADSIPKGETVLVEDPILFSFATPFVNCEHCFRYSEQLYTCFNCRYKTYCSVKCMESDKAEHDHECIGYKYIVLLALDATRLFRWFMRVIIYLSDKVFNKPDLDKLTTVAEVWDYMIQCVEKDLPNASAYMKFLTTRPNYDSLSNAQFTTLITYTFRLTIFVYRMTRANELCFNKLKLPMRQTMILIGAILMRLNCHIILNSKETEFSIADLSTSFELSKIEQENKTNKQAEESTRVNSNIYNHYNINAAIEFPNVYKRLLLNLNESPIMLPQTEHTLECPSIQSTLTNYLDNVVETCLDVRGIRFFLFSESSDMGTTPTAARNLISQLAGLSYPKLSEFMVLYARTFHFYVDEYFFQLRFRRNNVRQVVTNMCTTLLKFGHSCSPNVAIVHLGNGIILGKTLRDIKPNEELTISYKANYMQHSRSQRTAFLRYNGIVCNRKCCTSDEMDEPTNIRSAVYCDICEDEQVKITPLEERCSICNTSYNQILLSRRLFIHAIEEEILQKSRTMAGSRELAVLLAAYYHYVSKHFVEFNEFRLRAALHYVKFLAQENFSQQACDVIFLIRSHLKHYGEVSMHFDFNAEILDTIKIILHNVLDYSMHTTMERNSLSKLCTLATFILKGQESYINFYCGNDFTLAPIYTDLRRIKEWQEKIDAFVLMPAELKLKVFTK